MFRHDTFFGFALGFVCLTAVSAVEIPILPAADTSLFDIVPTNNLGADPWLAVGRTKNGQVARALLRFSLTNLPPGTVVTGARLEFDVVRVPQQITPVPSHFALHRMLRTWIEGTKTGSLGQGASPGEPTWLAASHPSTLWSAPGAGGAADSAAAASAVSATPVDDFGRYQFDSSPGLVADVQAWVNTPSSNHGWLMRSQGEATNATARRIGSREDFSKPRLLVTVATAGTAQITEVRATNGLLWLHIHQPAGQGLDLQMNSNLLTGAWLAKTNFPAPPANTNFAFTDPMGAATSRFYRVTAP